MVPSPVITIRPGLSCDTIWDRRSRFPISTFTLLITDLRIGFTTTTIRDNLWQYTGLGCDTIWDLGSESPISIYIQLLTCFRLRDITLRQSNYNLLVYTGLYLARSPQIWCGFVLSNCGYMTGRLQHNWDLGSRFPIPIFAWIITNIYISFATTTLRQSNYNLRGYTGLYLARSYPYDWA